MLKYHLKTYVLSLERFREASSSESTTGERSCLIGQFEFGSVSCLWKSKFRFLKKIVFSHDGLGSRQW